MENNTLGLFHTRRERITHSLLDLQTVRNDFREARKIIGESRELIYAYLSKQDDAFYKRIEVFFAENRPALKMVEFLRQDIKSLKIKTFGFYEQYGYGNPFEQGKNFARDLRWYMQLVTERFRVEEDYMLPLLKRMSDFGGRIKIDTSEEEDTVRF